VQKIVYNGEVISIDLGSRTWKKKRGYSTEQTSVSTWRFKADPNKKWSEQIAAWSYRKTLDSPPSLTSMMNLLRDYLITDCPDIFWHVIDETSNSILYEWNSERCEESTLRYQVIRIIDGENNRFRVGMAQRFSKPSKQKRNMWINNLSAIEIKPAN